MTEFDDETGSSDEQAWSPTWNAAPAVTPPAADFDAAHAPTEPVPPSFEAPVWPSWPPTAPQPGASGPGGWAPHPYGASGWPPPPEQTNSKPKRIAAAVAAIALVLASAGIGAAVAVTVRGDRNGRANNALPNIPNFPLTPGNGSNSNGSTGSGPLDTNAIATRVDDTIVNINTTLGQTGRAAGTGMVISADGYVLTNNHVIADATSIQATIGGKGSAHSAKVVGYDVADDVALIKVDGVSNLKTITFGDPSKLEIGDPVVAIGNALGKGGTPTATQGKITALDQDVTAGDPGGVSETLHGMIQIDAPIQPGDSGGALLNANAEVIGMNTAAAGSRFAGQLGSNIGFAIPVDNATTVVRQIQSGDESDGVHIGDRALLGVQVRDASSQSAFGDGGSNAAPVDTGALVVGVEDGSAAGNAGIETGDVIVSVDDKDIAGQNELHLALTKYHPGDKVNVVWVDSSGNRHSGSVELKLGPPA
jgi:S1-C subfamily serine protease